jgi:glycosyltransferase involved in cell wall biosynthesis
MKLAYFTSRYPAISHTFVMREVLALRKQGVTVATFSQRTPPADDMLATLDRSEREETCYILPPRWSRLLAAHVRTAVTRPLRYLGALAFALTTRPAGVRALLWHLFYFVEAVLLWDELRRRGLRHVHVHFEGACAAVAMVAARLGDLSYSMTVHGSTVFFDVHRMLLREKIERAAFVFCISEFTRAQVAAQVGPEHWPKLHVVHCGIEAGTYQPRPARDVRPTAAEILCVGRLVAAKGQALLLQALAALEREFPLLRCTLVGDGPDRTRLAGLARDLRVDGRVTFAGSVGQDDIQTFYERADLFVLPSFAEGVPVVLMEAMAKGLPVVGTRVGGTGELIEDGVTGLLVAPGNADALANALRRLLTDAECRERLAGNGRRKVLAEFEMGAIGRRVVQLFQTYLEPAPAACTAPQPRSAEEAA